MFELMMVEYEPDALVAKLHSAVGDELGNALITITTLTYDVCKQWYSHTAQ